MNMRFALIIYYLNNLIIENEIYDRSKTIDIYTREENYNENFGDNHYFRKLYYAIQMLVHSCVISLP